MFTINFGAFKLVGNFIISSFQAKITDLTRSLQPFILLRDQIFNQNANSDNADRISVIKENLEVGKRKVDSGSVRVRSRVVEKPVEEHVRLRKERVYVTRKPVDRQLSDNEKAELKDETIEMAAHSEQAVVNKMAHVVEEISINKDVDMEDKKITDTVRETQVDIDGDENSDRNERDLFDSDREIDDRL